MPSIELLESRIAPAAVFTYTDVDGDAVTIKTSMGTNAELEAIVMPFLVLEPGGRGPELQQIDFSMNAAVFAGTNLAITAKRTAEGGDGLVNVGYIDATGVDDGAALDLGLISIDGDLGVIAAGDAATTTTGVKGITAKSVAQWGTSTQTAGGTTFGEIAGAIGFIKVAGDVRGTFVLLGANGNIGSITVGGSIVGGISDGSGQFFADGTIGPVKVGGDIEAVGSGQNSGRIRAAGPIASVTVGGSLIGNSSVNGGTILSSAAIGPVKIGGDIVGLGESCGVIRAQTLTSVTIGGSLMGGTDIESGRIESSGDMGRVKIGRDVVGGSATGAGRIESGGKLTSVTIGGSLIGGNASKTGFIEAAGAIGAVKIRGEIEGGDLGSAVTRTDTGSILGKRISSVHIGGSIIAGSGGGGGILLRSGAITAMDDLGPIVIKGSLVGNDTMRATIFARGQLAPGATSDVAIKSITIGGRVENAWIFGGVNTTGVGANGNAQIGPVNIGGDWIASSLSSGVTSSDGNFGDSNDALIAGFGNDAIVAKIASISIRGQVVGEPGTTQTFGFVSEQIGSFKVSGTVIPLLPGRSNDTFAAGKAQPVGPAFSNIPGDGFAVHVYEV